MTSPFASRSKVSCLALIATAAVGSQFAFAQEAVADGVSVHLGGSAHVDGAVHVNVDAVLGALAHVEAGLSVGIGFAEPPPPPPPPVPSYYVEYVQPAPVYVAPEPVYLERPMAPVPQPSIERWGLGAFAGSVHVDGQEVGSDLGLLGRYRLSRAWSLEGELAKTTSTNGSRVDRRLGGALVWTLPLGRKLSPFLLLGAGYGQSELGDGEFHAEQGYGELGAGLTYRLTKSLHIMADVRAGARSSSDDVTYVAKGGVVELEEDESYDRARIGAMLFF